jgi:uncharacterized protein
MEAIKKYISVVILLLGVSVLSAQELPNRPTPPRLVVDWADILTPAEERALEQKLVRFNDTTSNQILVIITDDLLGFTPEIYASGIGDKWGVGQAEFDNGVVVLVKPKIGNNFGRAFISVGYGLDGAIPDITAGQIVDWEMIPYFKQNDYYGGLDAATTVLMELAAGEYNSDEYASSQGKGWFALIPFIIIFLIILLISRAQRRSRTIGSRGMSPWTAFFLGSMMGGGSSGWGGGSSGSSWGGGGGGFGGFGGGGFDGGGAGGSW